MKSNITKEQAQSALNLTAEIIDEFGPRLTGTPACKKAGERLKAELGKSCTETTSEAFQCSRDAFLYFIRYFSISYLGTFICLIAGGDWTILAAVLTSFGCIMAICEFVFYKEFIDPLFKKTDGYNISGTIEPTAEVQQSIIISGHYDSPHVFRFLNKNQKLYKLRVIITTGLYFLITAISLWASYQWITQPGSFEINKELIYILGFGLIFMLQYFFFVSWDVSPGAGDNLISSAIAIKLADHFSIQNLTHTLLVFLCPDAEESGLRGAREYVKLHRETLQSIPTYNINMDSIYRLQDLRFLKSEINGTVPLDEKLGEKCKEIAKSLGYNIPSMNMPFGGGSTDAAEFAKAGIPALSIIGLDTTFTSGDVPYHTNFDTVDKIEPEAVLACMQIAEQLIIEIDTPS